MPPANPEEVEQVLPRRSGLRAVVGRVGYALLSVGAFVVVVNNVGLRGKTSLMEGTTTLAEETKPTSTANGLDFEATNEYSDGTSQPAGSAYPFIKKGKLVEPMRMTTLTASHDTYELETVSAKPRPVDPTTTQTASTAQPSLPTIRSAPRHHTCDPRAVAHTHTPTNSHIFYFHRVPFPLVATALAPHNTTRHDMARHDARLATSLSSFATITLPHHHLHHDNYPTTPLPRYPTTTSPHHSTLTPTMLRHASSPV